MVSLMNLPAIAALNLAGELDLLLPITALLPLTALLLVSQENPYQTLVLRGILGSVATLIYALLGAPDVALTEALVGTLLSTTLYAVALRSSMALRPEELETSVISHGWLEDGGRLVLRQQPLLQRLEQCPGYGRWREAGGDLSLIEGTQP